MKVQATKSITTQDGVVHRELVVVVFADRFYATDEDLDEKEAALAEKRAARLLRSLCEPRPSEKSESSAVKSSL